MPLEILPDCFDDATHHELDAEVTAVVEDFADGPLTLRLQRLLLSTIVCCSKGVLDEDKYGSPSEVRPILDACGELQEMVSLAWKEKQYRTIRNLAMLRAPERIRSDIDLSQSFQAKYRGVAVDGLHEYLTCNEQLFYEPRINTSPYFARLCYVVQSSGTGKSRMLTELGKKDCIVIYMNLRTEDDAMNFPPRDQIPAQILTRFPRDEDTYMMICYAFFIALFDTIRDHLSASGTTGLTKEKSDIEKWVNEMCDVANPRTRTRSDFFEKLYEKYAQIAVRDGCLRVMESFRAVGASLQAVYPNHSYKPKLVIAIDEAHSLTSNYCGYRPMNAFCKVVNRYSHTENRKHPIWVVFASTTSKIAEFSPPKFYSSSRMPLFGDALFPTYTSLGWDQNASALGDVDMEDISKADQIVGYGRALWKSLKDASMTPDSVLKIAAEKLQGASYFFANNANHVLAVLEQRFGLHVTFGHPDSAEHLENGVASHLCIGLATTPDRTWKLTSYPSEPFLSCVAAHILHRRPENLEGALDTLVNEVNCDLIEIGRRGELAGRLLWLLAKDLFVRTWAKERNMETGFPQTWGGHLVDCRMIPVVDWLEFVFGPRIWDEAEHARELFKNAYLNFSHWVTMEANVFGSEAGDLPLNTFTLRHWQRTSAVQCYHQQLDIDKIIPIYFMGEPGTEPAQSGVSQIFILDGMRKQTDARNVLRDIASERTGADALPLPYIAISANLGRDQELSATMETQGDTFDHCLHVCAGGIHGTYAFLEQHPAVENVVKTIVRLHLESVQEGRVGKYLEAQMQFGSAANIEYMKWEHGRRGLE